MKKSIEAFNRSPWYLQVIIGLVGLAVAVALAIPLSWLVRNSLGLCFATDYDYLQMDFRLGCQAGKLFSWKGSL